MIKVHPDIIQFPISQVNYVSEFRYDSENKTSSVDTLLREIYLGVQFIRAIIINNALSHVSYLQTFYLDIIEKICVFFFSAIFLLGNLYANIIKKKL